MKPLLLWNYFALAFSALLPLVNPLGSALLFVGLVGNAPITAYRSLARSVAINTVIFFAVIELIGSTILNFFGISLPIVQVSGGLVIAAMGWSLLNQKDSESSAEKLQAEAEVENIAGDLTDKVFYPFTFPLTAGPGCIVVMLTLSAHATQPKLANTLLAHCGLFLAVLVMSVLIYFAYANAPRITRAIAPSTAHGILRVIAFILFCIGVQIAWNGFVALIQPLLAHHT
jgi:multiple antibiotic resistance protein